MLEQSVGSLAPGLLKFGRCRCGTLSRSFNDLGICRRIPFRDHLLDKLDSALDLLRCHRLNPSRMLNSKISRAQQCQQLAVSCRLVLAHLGNCRWTAVPEVSQQRRDELAIQLLAMTRADRTAGRISFARGLIVNRKFKKGSPSLRFR